MSQPVLAASTGYPLLDVFWTTVYLVAWVIWLFLVIRIVGDVFRSPDLSGPAKAVWTVVLVLFPLVGALVYLVVRGAGMHARETQRAAAGEQALRESLEVFAPRRSPVDELARLADLRDRGVLDEQEFARLKADVLATH